MEAGEPSGFWATFWASIADGVAFVIAAVIALVDQFFALFAQFFRAAQGDQNPAFWDLTAAIVEDLTGVPVDAEKLKGKVFGSGRLAGMNELGSNIFNLLANEFLQTEAQGAAAEAATARGSGIGGLPAKPLTPEQGVDAARRFLGFVMSFSVQEANVAVLGELASLGFIENFREFGAGMARNLSLGRLSRAALRPLVDHLVGDPLEWAINKQYRPKLLGPGPATRAWLAGHMTAQELRDELALQGFSESKISAVISENLKDLSPVQIGALLSVGAISEQDARVLLARAGFNQEMSELYFEAEAAIAIQATRASITSRVLSGFLDGEINSDELDGVLVRLGVPEKLRTRFIGMAGELSRLPRRTLSLAQMRESFIHGTVDVTEFEDYLIRVGYRQDDRKILIIETLLDLEDEQQRLKLKAEREAARDRARAEAAAKAAEKPQP
jgi:hypothetical protein